VILFEVAESIGLLEETKKAETEIIRTREDKNRPNYTDPTLLMSAGANVINISFTDNDLIVVAQSLPKKNET
jgi:hypothetical protein